jgi:drug/metabolite transporter (DMT)-like permease
MSREQFEESSELAIGEDELTKPMSVSDQVAEKETNIAKAIAGTDVGSHQKSSMTFRLFVCLVFTALTATYPLLLALTKVDGKFLYYSSSAVLFNELAKLFFTVIMIIILRPGFEGFNTRSVFIMMIPSVIYMVGNNLNYLALEYASPVSVNMISNVRLIMVAIIYRLILGREISRVRWIAMILLLVAVICSQIRSDFQFSITFLGLLISLLKALISVGNGVYTELVLKHHVSNFHVQSLQMYSWGVVSNIALFLYRNDKPLGSIMTTLTEGFTLLVWLSICMSAVMGIFIGAMMKHLDNIAKFFCTSFANVLLGIATAYLMPGEFQLSTLFLVSAIVISWCSYIYTANTLPAVLTSLRTI